MKPIRTKRLILRNWEDRDRDLFFRINSDDQVMEFFPFRRDRIASDALFDRLRAGIAERCYGFAAVEIIATGECIGFVGIADTSLEPFLPAGTVEIGWRLAPEFWGHGYVAEAAHAWLAFGFEEISLAEIVSFAVFDNRRSTAVMERIGMRADPRAISTIQTSRTRIRGSSATYSTACPAKPGGNKNRRPPDRLFLFEFQ